MKTTTKAIAELVKTDESPLPLDVIPNNMGINLCSVDAITWTRQDDGQLVSLTIHFIPTADPRYMSQLAMHNKECFERITNK